MQTINKSDFVLQLKETGYTKKEATMIVDDVLNLLEKNFSEGNTVTFHGFGTFDMHLRKARASPHFITGELITIPEHYVIKFTPGNRLRKIVRVWESTPEFEQEEGIE
jgi:nucleoid DNA-binding protein